MRVLCLTHRLPYAPNRGDRVRAYHLIRLLARHHEVDLVSLIHDDEEMSHVDDLRDVVASVTGALIPRARNLVAAAAALFGSRPLTHVLLHSPDMRRILRERVTQAPPDIVLAYCSGMARYAVEPHLARFPFVFDMVDVDSEKWAMLARTAAAPQKWIYEREARRLRAFERFAMSRARATTVVSERERLLLETTADGPRAMVVANGVDVDTLTPREQPASDPRVVFCGVFNYQPNEEGALWVAAEVWPLVTRAEPRATLALVGMNPTRAIRGLTRDPSIQVTGAVPDVRPHLWRSAVSIAPLRMARGVQNKVLEALAAGLPCVVTPQVLEGLPLSVRPACLSASDAQSFAEAILSLLRVGASERRAMASHADLKGLSWETQLRPLADLIVGGAGATDESRSSRRRAPEGTAPSLTGQSSHVH